MGCDIHSMVEVRTERYRSERREHVPGLPWVIGAGGYRWQKMDDEIFMGGWGENRSRSSTTPLDDRNYTLFALLADVRNGRGFAGVITGDRIEPLAEPRGVPTDASYEWLSMCDHWGPDMHSHTYFTLAELIELEPMFSQRLVRTGAIKGLEYERIKREGGTPTSWSGSVTGPGIRTVTPDEYDAGERGTTWTDEEKLSMRDAWLAGGAKRGEEPVATLDRLDTYISEGRTYVQYVWEDSLVLAVDELVDAIAALKRWAADLPPEGKTHYDGTPAGDEPGWYGHGTIKHEDIRIVMGFDN